MLYVRLIGELPPIFLPARPPTPVGEALGIAAQMWGKDPAQCHLRYGETVFDDPARVLADYGITGVEVLELEVK